MSTTTIITAADIKAMVILPALIICKKEKAAQMPHPLLAQEFAIPGFLITA